MAPVMVPFANGKGGVGKTALACSYAVARAREGAEVVLADVNEEQRTALAWCQVRDHNSLLPKIRVEAANARQALEMRDRHEVLVVDTPGWTDKTTLSLAKRATFMVIPTGPNPTYDLAPTVRLLHGLRSEGIEMWRLGIVLSRFATDDLARAQEEEVARSYLKQAGYNALDGCIRNDAAFSAALSVGYGLTEVEGSPALGAEAGRMMDAITKGVASAEAGRMMDAITKGVASAERRYKRSREPDRDKGHEQEGHER